MLFKNLRVERGINTYWGQPYFLLQQLKIIFKIVVLLIKYKREFLII